MKKQVGFIIGLMVTFLLCAYLLLTPLGAIKLQLLGSGHLLAVFTVSLDKQSAELLKRVGNTQSQFYLSLENAPYTFTAQTIMENWYVDKCGIFYVAELLGNE